MVLDDEIAAQFAAMNAALPDRPVNALSEAEDFAVFPANWLAICAFIACETQWRAVSTQAEILWLGLDYVAVETVLRRVAPEADFADIQIMERAALEVFGGQG